VKVAILGLSITSSWGNGHATNYRALARALSEAGDEVTFLERDTSWYAAHRDLPAPGWAETRLYDSLEDLQRHHASPVRQADLVIVGSFVPEGVHVAHWVLSVAHGAVAFYDIDTPVTLGKLRSGEADYLTGDLVERFDLYLSFTAGPALEVLGDEFGARRPCPFYCFVDAQAYRPVQAPRRWTLNYLGTYCAGRQPALQELLLDSALALPGHRFAVAGPMYPDAIRWPDNVERMEHLAPGAHPEFYCASAFTLNVTRPEMRVLGYSPSVRLFEAAACGVPIISDLWPGLDEIFVPGREIFVAETGDAALAILTLSDEETRRRVAAAARRRVLAEHTGQRRVAQLHELMCRPVSEALP
jgi:spore maturation protein CgeB